MAWNQRNRMKKQVSKHDGVINMQNLAVMFNYMKKTILTEVRRHNCYKNRGARQYDGAHAFTPKYAQSKAKTFLPEPIYPALLPACIGKQNLPKVVLLL